MFFYDTSTAPKKGAVQRVPDFSTPLDDKQEFRTINEHRKPCTDTLFLVLFILFILGMLLNAYSASPSTFLEIVSFSQQHDRLYRPTDYLGRVCGVNNRNAEDGIISIPNSAACKHPNSPNSNECIEQVQRAGLKQDLTDKPFLYYFDLTKPFALGGVCVSKCPGTGGSSSVAIEQASSASKRYCPPELQNDPIIPNVCLAKRLDAPGDKSYPEAVTNRLLISSLEYRPVMFRCLPNIGSQKSQQANYTAITEKKSNILGRLNSFSMVIDELWADVARSWKLLLVSAVIAILLGFSFLILVRIYAHIFVWFAVVALFVALTGAGLFGIVTSYADNISEVTGISALGGEDGILVAYFPNFRFYASLVSLALALAYALFVGAFYTRIQRATGVFREAALAVASLPHLLIVPVLLFIVISVFLVFWVQVALTLWSAVGSSSVSSGTTQFSWSIAHRLMFGYHLFGFFWVTQFFVAFLYTSVAGAVAEWYWIPQEEKQRIMTVREPILRAIIRPCIYHLGSLALGSLIVGLVQFVSYLFQRLVKSLQKITGESTIVRIIHSCVRCFLGFLNNIVKQISKHAYIQIAIFGKDFFTSSKNAIMLIKRNANQIAVVDYMSDTVIFIAQLAISVITTYLASMLTRTRLVIVDPEQELFELKASSRVLVLVVCFFIHFT